MSKKLSAVGLVALALCLCCAFSVVPKTTKAQDEPQDLTVQERYMTEPPLAILNARRTDEGLTVEVQNKGLAPIEYFELNLIGACVWEGRNSLTEQFRDDPRNLEQEELSLAPKEVRTFQFPVKKSGNVISVEMVLLSNGQGWFKHLWLKKLDNANENGMLWAVDNEETKRKLVGRRISDIRYFIK